MTIDGSGNYAGINCLGDATITAKAGEYAAGIGTGSYGSCGSITISGGTVTATGGIEAAGIGTGSYGSCGTVKIGGKAGGVAGSPYIYQP